MHDQRREEQHEMAGVLFQIPSIVSSHNTESEARSVSHDTEDVGDDHKFHDDLNGNYGSYAIAISGA